MCGFLLFELSGRTESLSPLLHCRGESVCFFWGIFMFDELLFHNPAHVTRAQMRSKFSEANRMSTSPAIPRRHCEQHGTWRDYRLSQCWRREVTGVGEARGHYTHTAHNLAHLCSHWHQPAVISEAETSSLVSLKMETGTCPDKARYPDYFWKWSYQFSVISKRDFLSTVN